MPVKKLILACEALNFRGQISGQRPTGDKVVQMSLRDATGGCFAPRFAEMLPDDEGGAPGVSKLFFLAVFLGLLVAAEDPFLGADVLGPVVGQFFERSGSLL